MMISSKDNPQVKALKRLIHHPKRNDALMAVEGAHACQLLLKHQAHQVYQLVHDWRIERVWVGSAALDNEEIQVLLSAVVTQGIQVIKLATAVFRDISSLEQGVSIVFEVQRPKMHSLSEDAFSGNVVLLDGVQDPGNMGSIIRSCAAAGVREVWLSEHCVNPYAPKVLRAGVGAHFGLNIRERIDLNQAIVQLQHHGVQVCATSSHTKLSIYQHDLSCPTAWLMGNEGAGLREALLAQADVPLTSPMVVGESLNVAAAAAVCVFEMARQQQGG